MNKLVYIVPAAKIYYKYSVCVYLHPIYDSKKIKLMYCMYLIYIKMGKKLDEKPVTLFCYGVCKHHMSS